MAISRGDIEKAAGGGNLFDLSADQIESAYALNPYGAEDALISSLEHAKRALIDGEITTSDFVDFTSNVAPKANHVLNTITTWGSNWATGAHSMGPRLYKFMDTTNPGSPTAQGDFKDINFERAFTRREIAKIPEASLPTREEVEAGDVFLEYFPIGMKFRPEPKIEEPPIVEPPLPPDQKLIETPTPLPKTPSVGPITPEPTVQLPEEAGIGTLIGDPFRLEQVLKPYQEQIEQFGRRQEEQMRQMFQVQEQQREQRLSDLASLLASEEQRAYEQFVPGEQERLNTLGLLRSSALGESLSREKTRLQAEREAALAGQALEDREAAIQATQGILQPRLATQQAAIERMYSLEDLEREQNLARELAAAGVPYAGSAGGMSTGEGVFQGALTGAAAGSVVPGWGNLIGAIVGGVGGGLAADK